MSYRGEVMQGFDYTTKTYRHVLSENSITGQDNLSILSLLAGAAHMAGDFGMKLVACDWINKLEDGYRNFDANGPTNAKPQASAGKLAYEWAVKHGCGLEHKWNVDFRAEVIAAVPGWVIRLRPFRQHINTCMLAHLYLGRKPNTDWDWVIDGNAFYSYIAGIKCPVPEMRVMKPLTTKLVNYNVSIEERKGSQWIWKQNPNEIVTERSRTQYTPTALLVAQYLQETLTDER